MTEHVKFFVRHGFHSYRLAKFKNKILKEEAYDFDKLSVHDHPDYDALHQRLTGEYFYHNDKENHTSGIMYYTGHSSYLNHNLWKGDTSTHNRVIERLDSLTSRPLLSNLKVFSGLGNRDEDIASALLRSEHNILHLPAYTSTSIKLPIAHSFSSSRSRGGHSKYFKEVGYKHDREDSDIKTMHSDVLAFSLRKGINHGAYIASHSLHPKEKEFLLPRDIHIKVDKHPLYTESKISEGATNNTIYHRHVWHAKVLTPEELKQYE